MPGLVLLAYDVDVNEVTDQAVVTQRKEGSVTPLQCFLHSLMAHAMGLVEHQWPGRC
jgi:hypothetical protein